MASQPYSPSTPSTFSSLDPARQKIALQRAQQKVIELRLQAIEGLERIQLEVDRRQYASLKGFIHGAWSIVEPVKMLVWNWHLDVLCREIEEICLYHEDESEYVVINVPPGTMKSLLFVFARAWLWSKRPGLRFLGASYGATLSTRDNVKLRDIILSPWYKRLYPQVVFKGDQNAKEKFETTEKGWSLATSVGGAATGEHPDIAILDDLISEDQSRSDEERKTANDWVDRTIGARGIVRKVKVFMIAQRFHEDDPPGHVLKKGGWRHICFPMRYELSHKGDSSFAPDPLDCREEEGELLWPELYPEKSVRDLEIKLGEYASAGQLQQRPSPEGGGQFKREWFRFISVLPSKIRRSIRGWDTAGTEGDGDYTTGVKLHEAGEDKHLFYVIENVVRDQLSPYGVDMLLLQTAQLDGDETPHREEKEPGGSGKAVIAAHTQLLIGYDHKGVLVSRSKIIRAKPFRAQCEAGNVYILRTGDPVRDAWIEPYLSELSSFPTGTNDDQVDGSSCAFNQLLLEPIRNDWVTF